MRIQILFSNKQRNFMRWIVKYLHIYVHKEKPSGLFRDKVTNEIIAQVYAYESNIFVSTFIRIIIWLLTDKDAKINRKKCIYYGFLMKD